MKTIEHNNFFSQIKQYPVSERRNRVSDLFAGHRIIAVLFDGYQGPVGIKLWDDKLFSTTKNTQCVLHIHHPGVLRDLILKRDLVKLAEAFIAGHVDVTGDLESLFQLEDHLRTIRLGYKNRLRLLFDALHLPSLQSNVDIQQVKAGEKQQDNSRQAISHHYDVGNDFYRLWLDQNMVYSCAYFRNEAQTLDEAQQDKLDYLCRKLRLQPGQTLLDIGCGWGALAIWAAEHYGVNVHGVTLSKEQQSLANEKIKAAGLEHRITIELLDYRNLSDDIKYDRIVSVGMFEHIGVKNFPVYFRKIKCLLKPGGLFLNHGITIKGNQFKSPLKRFINQYIFPDGELARISEVNAAMEQAGFEIIDVESLRRHYALTLRRWVKSLEANMNQAAALTSRETYRLWWLYMAGFAYYFDEGTVNVHQILVAHQHSDLPNPLRREDLYD